VRGLGDPRIVIATQQQTLDDRSARLAASLRGAIGRRRQTLASNERRLAYLHPRSVVARERVELSRVDGRMRAAWDAQLASRVHLLERASARLDAMSPLKVLARGYAIATVGEGEGARAVRSVADVRPGDALHVRVQDGRVEARVTDVERVERVERADPIEKP
jgi:exodeoxyribonuclease VII large subunit